MSATTTLTHEPVTATNVLRLFPDVNTSYPPSHRAHSDPSAAPSTTTTSTDNDLAGYDEEQIRLMDEVCIVLDADDNPIGSASKKTCHLMANIDRNLLHRAFSVFLFQPSTKKLLLQQRASEKITFPDMWTNTVCSHPLGVPGETGADLDSAVLGVKRAAQRKLGHELGIKKEQVPLEKFHFLSRIHYKAPSDRTWGEHEIDYILFIETDVDLEPSPNEVRDVKYVTPDELREQFKDKNLTFTPWFKLICESMLFEWWKQLEGGIEKLQGDKLLRRM